VEPSKKTGCILQEKRKRKGDPLILTVPDCCSHTLKLDMKPLFFELKFPHLIKAPILQYLQYLLFG